MVENGGPDGHKLLTMRIQRGRYRDGGGDIIGPLVKNAWLPAMAVSR